MLSPAPQAVGARSMNTALSVLYHEGFYIRSKRAEKVSHHWLLFLQKYAAAAGLVYNAGLSRFPLVPKLHYLHHGALRLLREAQRGGNAGWAINPLSESVQMQEDYIGRPSRLSRRVCPKKVHLRVCQRSLIAVRQSLKKSDVDQRGLFAGE